MATKCAYSREYLRLLGHATRQRRLRCMVGFDLLRGSLGCLSPLACPATSIADHEVCETFGILEYLGTHCVANTMTNMYEGQPNLTQIPRKSTVIDQTPRRFVYGF